jgi:hypothetical protein
MKIKIPHCQHCKTTEKLFKNSCRKNAKGEFILGYMCRECNRRRALKYRKTSKGIKNVRKAVNKSIEKWKEKQKSRNKLFWAIKGGKIEKSLFCCLCGKVKKVEAHHHDYLKPLAIHWVCRSCHADIHRTPKIQFAF